MNGASAQKPAHCFWRQVYNVTEVDTYGLLTATAYELKGLAANNDCNTKEFWKLQENTSSQLQIKMPNQWSWYCPKWVHNHNFDFMICKNDANWPPLLPPSKH